nr:DUF3552 domain-containing protein [Actinomycetota bacterium]
MTTALVAALAVAIGLAIGFAVGVIGRRVFASRRLETAESRAAMVVADAEREAETKVRQALVEVKEEI